MTKELNFRIDRRTRPGLVAGLLAGGVLVFGAACGSDGGEPDGEEGNFSGNSNIPEKTIEMTSTPTGKPGETESLRDFPLDVDPTLSGYAKVGEVLPDLEFISQSGEKVNISTYFGKPLVLVSVAVGCGPCQAQWEILSGLREEYDNKFNLIALTNGISFNEVKESYIPLLHREENDVDDIYNMQLSPTTLFLDENGVLKRSMLGYAEEDEGYKFILDKVIAGEEFVDAQDFSRDDEIKLENFPFDIGGLEGAHFWVKTLLLEDQYSESGELARIDELFRATLEFERFGLWNEQASGVVANLNSIGKLLGNMYCRDGEIDELRALGVVYEYTRGVTNSQIGKENLDGSTAWDAIVKNFTLDCPISHENIYEGSD